MLHVSASYSVNRLIIETELSLSQAMVQISTSAWEKHLDYECRPDTYVMVLHLTAPLSRSKVSLRKDQWFGDAKLPGRLSFGGAGTIFSVSLPPGELRYLTVEFDPEWFETITEFRSQWRPNLLSSCVNIHHPRLAQCLLNLLGEVQAPARTSKRLAESITTEIAIYMARYLDGVASQTPTSGQVLSDWQMRQVTAHIENMNGYLPEIASLARLCGVGERHFRRLFRQTTGRTISDCARDIWVSKTKRHLADSTLAIKEVASLAGFSDASNFATAFRRAAGVTPKAFRKHTSANV